MPVVCRRLSCAAASAVPVQAGWRALPALPACLPADGTGCAASPLQFVGCSSTSSRSAASFVRSCASVRFFELILSSQLPCLSYGERSVCPVWLGSGSLPRLGRFLVTCSDDFSALLPSPAVDALAVEPGILTVRIIAALAGQRRRSWPTIRCICCWTRSIPPGADASRARTSSLAACGMHSTTQGG